MLSRLRRLTALPLVAILCSATPAAADPVRSSTLGWAVNGIVSEVARAGDVAFLGGSFGSVAPAANLVHGFATFATDSAVPVLPRLDVNGRVRAVVALPGGGWLIGGEFSQVNGSARGKLARLLADGSLDPTFTLAADDTVWALAVQGTRVYVGGEFNSLGGSARDGLAALDAAALTLDATFLPSVTGGAASVCTLVATATVVYAGGTFTTVNGIPHANLTAVDAVTGATVVAFIGTADGRVATLAVGHVALRRRRVRRHRRVDAAVPGPAGCDHRYGRRRLRRRRRRRRQCRCRGGRRALRRRRVRADRRREPLADRAARPTGAAAAWNPDADGEVEQLGVSGTALVVGGHFKTIGGLERLRLASTTAITLSWNPALSSSVEMVHVDAGGVLRRRLHLGEGQHVPRPRRRRGRRRRRAAVESSRRRRRRGPGRGR